MNADVFVFEGLLLAVCFTAHIFLWRRFSFKNQAAALLIIFILPLVLFSVFFLYLSKTNSSVECILSLALLHAAITCAYLQTYPAIQGLSPSLFVLMAISEHSRGLTEIELTDVFKENFILDEKLQDLLGSGLINEGAGKLNLTRRGKIFVLPFIFLRKVLGLEMGRG